MPLEKPSPLPAQRASCEPVAVRVDEAGRRLGVGRDKVYQLLRMGLLEGRKLGKATLIPVAGIERFLSQLPAYPVSAQPTTADPSDRGGAQ